MSEDKVSKAMPVDVYFGGNFWGHPDSEQEGKQILIHKKFRWGDENWYIPAVYLCDAGLVMDFCVEKEPEELQAFIDKWDLYHENQNHYSEEQYEQMDAENPLSFHAQPGVIVNGVELRRSFGCGISWIPKSCLKEGMACDEEARVLLEHYQLDPLKGWKLWRGKFLWTDSGADFPDIRTLQVRLEPEPISVPGIHFSGLKTGESVSFIHPGTGISHTLTMRSCEQAELTGQQIPDWEGEFPRYYQVMTYQILPEAERGEISIFDCENGDRPKNSRNRANGSTAVFVAGSSRVSEYRVACSSLYFNPVQDVEWRIVFQLKDREEIEVDLGGLQ